MRRSITTLTDFHFFSGIGGFANGFRRSQPRAGPIQGHYHCLGGVDNVPARCKDFARLAGVPGDCMDLFTREQYYDFHGHLPPAGWRETTPDDIRKAADGEFPDVVALSPPCKGYSGLLNKKSAASLKYQALNELVARSILLMSEAWMDDPPSLIVLENVPMIESKGGPLLDATEGLLHQYGYSVARTRHDCGELGGLAQHRNRFLLVARHMEKVPPFLYEPPKQRIRGVGEVLSKLPLPGDPRGGPMHTLPSLHWKTWVRLALIRAGHDWRDLEDLDWQNYGVVPETAWHRGIYGVSRWDQPACTVTGRAGVTTGRFSVADPRAPRDLGDYQPYGVIAFDQPSRTVTGRAAPGAGPYSVADPRLGCDVTDRQTRRFNNVYRLVHWDDPSQAVTAGGTPSSGGQAVADPRVRCKSRGGSFSSARHYGVVRWGDPSLAVVGHAKHDNGAFSVADPRLPEDHEPQKEPPVIISMDGTRHRPFTTFELAALQGFPVFDDDGAPLVLEGKAHGKWRESIGNAVPPPSAKAIADVMGQTLLLSRIEMSVPLPDEPVWVKQLRIALSVETQV